MESNRLLDIPQFTPGSREWYENRLYGTGIPVDAAQQNAEGAEFAASMAPVTGEAISARDAWNASGQGAQAIAQGNYGQAAGEYGNMLLGIAGAIPGVGVVARGTKRGAAWMDRNLPEGMNRLLDAMTPAASKDTVYAIPAWHGSPHDFDKFDVSRVGTGEGAQAYGHGLYFAESPAVAKSYRDTLSGEDRIFHGADELTEEFGNAATVLNQFKGDKDAARGYLKDMLANPGALGDPTYIKKTLAALDGIDPAKLRVQSNAGRLYRTELDVEPEDLLDWDKPLSEQSEKVKENLLGLINQLRNRGETPSFGWNTSGSEIYRQLMSRRKELGPGRVQAINEGYPAATNLLREAGIPGIRYLDQGSRGASEGTRNMVIFDDQLVKILGKE